jgi:hypothetical protein
MKKELIWVYIIFFIFIIYIFFVKIDKFVFAINIK